jgi:hypothetical protein
MKREEALQELMSALRHVNTMNYTRLLAFAHALCDVDYRMMFNSFGIPRVFSLIFLVISMLVTEYATQNFVRGDELVRRVYYAYIALVPSLLSSVVVFGILVYEQWLGTYSVDWAIHVFCMVMTMIQVLCGILLACRLRRYEKALSWLTEDHKPKTE